MLLSFKLHNSMAWAPQALYDYNAPAPPGGLHRYIFTLYSQPGGANVTVHSTPDLPRMSQ